MNVRTFILAIVALNLFAPIFLVSSNAADIVLRGQPGQPDVVIHYDLNVEVIYPSEDTAQLLVLRGKNIEARSAPFGFYPHANYGATWVEAIEFTSSSAFTVNFRTRGTCGPSIYNYNFAKRNGRWVVSGLERTESQCSAEDGFIVDGWHKSYNYLSKKVKSVTFDENGRHPKTVVESKEFPVFLLTEFEALDSRYEP
jgi:hypothetical protein